MTRRWRLVLVAAVLVAAACSGSDDEDPVASEPAASPVAEVAEPADAEPPTDDFCRDATAFVTSSDARLITTPDAEVFVEIDAALAALDSGAPDAVLADVATLRDGFAEIGEAYETTGFDPTALLDVPQETLLANGSAVRSLEDFLLDSCGLAEVRDEQIADITEAFGIQDPALAECLHTQLGDVANIDSSSLTPELMITEVCGTSILGLLSGEGETDS